MSFATSLAAALADMFAPLRLAFIDADHMASLFEELGWTVELLAEDLEVIGVLLPVLDTVENLTDLVDRHAVGEVSAGELVEQGVVLGRAVFDAIAQLRTMTADGLTGLLAPLDDPHTWREIALALPEYLFGSWVRSYHPLAHALMVFGGVITLEPRDGLPPRTSLDWEAFGALLSNPPEHLARVYGWDEQFDHDRLLAALAGVARAMGVDAYRNEPSEVIVHSYFGGLRPTEVRQLSVPIHRGWTSDRSAYLTLGLIVVPVVEAAMSAPNGLLLSHELVGQSAATLKLGEGWTLSLDGELDTSGALGITMSPDGVNLATGDAIAGLSIRLRGQPDQPWPLLGDEEGTRLQLEQIALEVAVQGSASRPELLIQADASDGLKLVLEPGEGDSFLADVLGDGPLELRSGLSLRWSSENGVAFGGGAGLEVVTPVNLNAGPLRIDCFRVALAAGSAGASAEVTITGALTLGALTFVVEDIGVSAALVPVARESGPGDFGSTNATLAFLPPTGLGIEIDVAGAVSGGGFLSRNADTGEYAGILELAMLGVGLTATGLLATRLPGGAEGWSLFFSLAATFTGVQLGFGFTLEGVGGLIGINRGLDERALGEGIRTGALDSILFPEDPIAAAPRILRDIDAIFPIAVGQYVFGPIAKIGWGTPTLLELDVGFVLQLPDPLTISVLGSLSALLPSKDAPIVELHVDVAGTLNLSEGTLRIDASLRDSRVLNLELTGDMAVRSSFRDSPSFLIAFGGFHPDFKPPADFPALQRLGVALDTGDDLRITLRGYLALTSNTVQFGAEFKLRAQAVGFTAKGGASFDALIQFKPFGFVISMKVWVSISAGNIELLGVLLKGKLSGPNPWHAVGEATFKLLGCKKTLEVEAKFGSKANTPPKEAIDVAALLIEELRIDSAWTVLPPEGDGDSGVVLRDTDDSALEVHPAGRIEVRQRIVPLDLRIEQYGNATVAGVDQFTLASPRLGELAIERPEVVSDWFAAAHYFGLDEDEKLSAPSFEQLPAGLRMGDDELEGGDAVDYTYDYELVIRDPKVRSEPRERTKTIVSASRQALQRALQVGRAIAARKSIGLPRSHAAAGVVTVASTSFVVTDASTGARSSATPAAGLSFYAARERARSHDDPRACVLIPAYELELLE